MLKYRKEFLFWILFVAMGSLFCACKILPEPVQSPQQIYDVGIPEKIALPEKITLQVLPFTNSSAARRKIMLRTGEHTLASDEFHLWAQSPAQLLTLYLRSVFQPATAIFIKDSSRWTLSGDILAFEGNSLTRQVLLSVQCTLTCGSRIIRLPVTVTAPFPRESGKSEYDKTAQAMQNAMYKLAEQIKAELSTK